MSAVSERTLKIMAYADGELDEAERAEVEAWMAADADAGLLANDFANLGDLLKTGHDASSDGKAAASFDIADAVMAKIAAENGAEKSAREREQPAKVVSLAERRQSRTRVVGAAVCAALALAASVFVMTRPKEEQPMARAPVVTPAPHPPAPQAVASAEPGVDVDVVETPGHSVSVFYLPNDTALTTSVVVWVDETAERK